MSETVRRMLIVLCLSIAFSAIATAQNTPLFQFKFGGLGPDDGQLSGPRGIAIQGDEVYVVELGNDRVSVFDLAGNFLRMFGESGTSYVTDNTRHTVLKFDPAGNFVLEWGGMGSADSQLNQPQGIAIDGDGDVWVCDRFNTALKEFDDQGTFLSKVEGGNPMSGLTDVILNPDGSFYLTIWGGSYTGMRQFDEDGMVIRSVSASFQAPQGLAQSPDGLLLYVIASGPSNRAWVVDEMSFIVEDNWGGAGSEDDQFSQPWDIATADNGRIYVADRSNHFVKVFEHPVFADDFETGDTSGWSSMQ
ncbi:MAG: NHL repeat-containing protein [Acidobacteriota bacterium]